MSKDKNKREQKQEANEAHSPTLAGADLSKETEGLILDQHEAVAAALASDVESFANRFGTSEAKAAFRSRADVLVTDAILGKEAGQALRSEGVQAAVRAIEAKEQRESCIKALKALVGAKVSDRLEGPLREVISDLTEGTVNAALKNRLEIIAAVCHDDAVKKALEALA